MIDRTDVQSEDDVKMGLGVYVIDIALTAFLH